MQIERIERWEVEWQEMTPEAKKRQQENPDTYEHNHDEDEDTFYKVFATEDAARTYAKKVVEAKKTVYGHATVTKQRLEPVEGTLHFDWENVGEPEYIE